MCGRYSLVCIDDLGNRFRVFEPTMGCRSRFNVAPSDVMPVIVHRGNTAMVMMQWGLISHTVKDPANAVQPINARAETLAERPLFRELLRDRRCLVPASGFYEWKQEGRHKIPFYFHLREDTVFAFAGLYDVWQDHSGGLHPGYTIITTEANDLVAPYHNRMPVILKRGDEERWIAGTMPSADEMKTMLRPYSPGEMKTYPVSSRVNSTEADDERLIVPLPTL